MKLFDSLIAALDRFLMRFISSEEIDKRDRELTREVGVYDQNRTKIVYEGHDSVDTKSTAILQHVSIMIAIASLLFSQSAKPLKWIFGFEAILYVLIALCCLRLFMAQELSGTLNDTQGLVAKEALFDRIAKITFIVTIAMVITFAAELVVG